MDSNYVADLDFLSKSKVSFFLQKGYTYWLDENFMNS